MKDLMARMTRYGFDTMVVVFFLAVEVGRSPSFGSGETLLMTVTMLLLLFLPYFLPSPEGLGPSIVKWLVFRAAAMIVGIISGLVLPGSMHFMPMNFLILAGICSCFVQFYGLMKLRLAD